MNSVNWEKTLKELERDYLQSNKLLNKCTTLLGMFSPVILLPLFLLMNWMGLGIAILMLFAAFSTVAILSCRTNYRYFKICKLYNVPVIPFKVAPLKRFDLQNGRWTSGQ